MIHHVFANKSNVGDWLSAIGIQKLLSPYKVVEHLCDEPFVPETLDALENLGADDIVVIGGGGLFMDYFEPFWEGFLPLASKIPFYIWGVGLCDVKGINSKPPPALMREIVQKCQGCFVRDSLSYSFIDEADLPLPSGCPAMNALSTEVNNPNGHLLHVDAFDNVGEEVYERINEIGMEWAKEHGRSFVHINNLIKAGSNSELEKILEIYSSASLIVTGRLHGCILSTAINRPFVTVSGDKKIESFMDHAGLSDWLIDKNEVGKLRELINKAINTTFDTQTFAETIRSKNRKIGELIISQYGNKL